LFKKFYVKMGFFRYMVHGQLVAVHDVTADQNGAPLDGEPEVCNFDSRVVPQLLRVPAE
jgi:hypothetical protein